MCLLLGGSLGRGRAYVPGVMPACSYAYPAVDRETGMCKNIAFATSLWREEMISYRAVEPKSSLTPKGTERGINRVIKSPKYA